MRQGTVPWARPLASRLLLPLAVGLLLAVAGPFGTFGGLGIGARALFWCGAVGVNWLLGELTVRVVGPILPARWSRHRIAVPLVAALVMSIPATAVVQGLAILVGLVPSGLPELYGQVLLVTTAILLAVYRPLPSAPTAQGEPRPLPLGSDRPETAHLFARRMPSGLGGQLLCLQMEDHYLRIHTDVGSALILCRMEDAAHELEGHGLRVHRSWWVARAALGGCERDGQRLFLRLRNGLRAPVGKTYRRALKEAGWLGAQQVRSPEPKPTT